MCTWADITPRSQEMINLMKRDNFVTCFYFSNLFLKLLYCMQVKLLNKLASEKASGSSSGSKVLTDLVEGLEEPSVAVELRLKIDLNHSDLKGYVFAGWS